MSCCPWPTRPNCLAKEAQPCWAFQTRTGSARTRARAPPAQSCQARNHGQFGANEGEPQDDAGADEQVGVLGEQAQPGAQAHREPPVGVARCPQLRKRPSGEAPEQDGGGIGRDDHAADRQQGHRQREPDGAPPDARTEQEGRGAPQHERADERDQDRAQANAQRTVACNPAPGGNHPPDHRRVVEVAHGRRQRPQAVVGFIVGEAERAGEPQAHERRAQNCGDEHGRGPIDTCRSARHGAKVARTGNRWHGGGSPKGWRIDRLGERKDAPEGIVRFFMTVHGPCVASSGCSAIASQICYQAGSALEGGDADSPDGPAFIVCRGFLGAAI